jgi:hypothetical protein
MGVIPRLTTPSEFRHLANGLEYELATPGLDAGGRALFEAKQLGLEQCFHERREVDDERAVPSHTGGGAGDLRAEISSCWSLKLF